MSFPNVFLFLTLILRILTGPEITLKNHNHDLAYSVQQLKYPLWDHLEDHCEEKMLYYFVRVRIRFSELKIM